MWPMWRITEVEKQVVCDGGMGEHSSGARDGLHWKVIPKKNFFGELCKGRFLLKANFDRGDGPVPRKTFIGGYAEPDKFWVLPTPLSTELKAVNNLVDSLIGKPGGGCSSWLRRNMWWLEDRLVYYHDEFVRVAEDFCEDLGKNVTIINVEPVTGLSYDEEDDSEEEDSLVAASSPTTANVVGQVGGTAEELELVENATREGLVENGATGECNVENSDPEIIVIDSDQEMESESIGAVDGGDEEEQMEGENAGNGDSSSVFRNKRQRTHPPAPWVYQRYNFRFYPRLTD